MEVYIYTLNADKLKEEIFDNHKSMLCSSELILLMLVILIDTICVVFGLWKFFNGRFAFQ